MGARDARTQGASLAVAIEATEDAAARPHSEAARHNVLSPNPLREQPLDDPPVAGAAVAEAVVQAIVAVLPELPGVRDDPKASPRLRPRELTPLRLRDELVECLPILEHL